MTAFIVLTKADTSEMNRYMFVNLEYGSQSVRLFRQNANALADYLVLQNRKNTLTARKREVINLVVSQVNECAYCLIAHTVAGGLQGFTTEEILLIRKANIDFDTRLGTLAKFVKATAINSGLPDAALVDYFLAADYSEAHLIDMILVKEIKRSVITCTALSFFL